MFSTLSPEPCLIKESIVARVNHPYLALVRYEGLGLRGLGV